LPGRFILESVCLLTKFRKQAKLKVVAAPVL
jgi:hypothetical protein